MTLSTMSSSTLTVVVFTPPPVDAGDAPMNMRMTLISLEESFIAARSTELNPAVRMVTDWKKALSSRRAALALSLARVAGLFHSTRA